MAPTKDLPAIKACLFDMDGLLIDSEDKYTICTNRVLREYGRPDLPWSVKAQLQGRPGPTASQILVDWAKLCGASGSPEWPDRDVYMSKIQAWQKDLFPECKPLPGVPALLQTLHAKTDVEMALATSSHAGNFKLKTDHQRDLFDVFVQDQRVLGDDPRLAPGRGKPAPDIWLLALSTINDKRKRHGKQEIKPEECLVFEDSVPGVESGRRAGMQVAWCPHEGLLNEYKGREERVLAGQMGEYKEQEQEQNNEQTGAVSHGGMSRHHGAPGELNDGWGRLVHSLEDFPYADYGIEIRGSAL